jgi:DUF1365 family protein
VTTLAPEAVAAPRGSDRPAAPSALHTCLYRGTVRHRRRDRVAHAFAIRLHLLYLDLDEVERALPGRFGWSSRWPAWMRFRRADYFGDPRMPLADAVRDAVGAAVGTRPTGAVRMLTTLRALGVSFNPVTFYYCFDAAGELAAVLAQITNTPWGERHHYVVAADRPGRRTLRGAFGKAFHVSPFQPMAQTWHWAFATPGERLAVHMENHAGGRCEFDATLVMRRAPWTAWTRAMALLRHPCMSLKALLGIYGHAFLLWWKGAPFHSHPKHRGGS